MAHRVEQIVKDGILNHLEKMGYELVDVEYRKREDVKNITVFIYKEDGISLNDCEKVHKEIDVILDNLDPTSGEAYILNVSSPGLDRAFKCQRDYERNISKEVEIKFFSPFDGRKKLQGVLLEYNGSNIRVYDEDNKKDILIRIDKIAKINLAINF